MISGLRVTNCRKQAKSNGYTRYFVLLHKTTIPSLIPIETICHFCSLDHLQKCTLKLCYIGQSVEHVVQICQMFTAMIIFQHTFFSLSKQLLTRKYPQRGYILGVLTHTTAWDRLWEGDVFLKIVYIQLGFAFRDSSLIGHLTLTISV